jgi:4-aminobutyrate aminotransferase-like enzyme
VIDSEHSGDSTRAQRFALTDVDGNRVVDRFRASRAASHEQGFSLTVVIAERQVPAKPMKATVPGSHTTAAPIHATASQLAGTFFPSKERLVSHPGQMESRSSAIGHP